LRFGDVIAYSDYNNVIVSTCDSGKLPDLGDYEGRQYIDVRGVRTPSILGYMWTSPEFILCT